MYTLSDKDRRVRHTVRKFLTCSRKEFTYVLWKATAKRLGKRWLSSHFKLYIILVLLQNKIVPCKTQHYNNIFSTFTKKTMNNMIVPNLNMLRMFKWFYWVSYRISDENLLSAEFTVLQNISKNFCTIEDACTESNISGFVDKYKLLVSQNVCTVRGVQSIFGTSRMNVFGNSKYNW